MLHSEHSESIIADLTTYFKEKQRLHLHAKAWSFDAEEYDNRFAFGSQVFAMLLYFSFTGRNTSQTLQEHKQHVSLKLELQNFLGYACHTLSSQGVA